MTNGMSIINQRPAYLARMGTTRTSTTPLLDTQLMFILKAGVNIVKLQVQVSFWHDMERLCTQSLVFRAVNSKLNNL